MTGWNEAFPYAVEDRIDDFTSNNWIPMCNWLDQTFPNEWDYFNGEFRFKTERAKMLFLLKWTNG